MTTLLLIVWIALAFLLLIIVAIRPKRSRHSWFELKRADNQAAMHREKLIGDIIALRKFLSAMLVVIITAIGIYIWQGWAIIYVILMVVLAQMLASRHAVQRAATKLYQPLEASLLGVLDRLPVVGYVLGSERQAPRDQRIESPEQLLHLIESADGVLTNNQQKLLVNGLNWHDTPVSKVMTSREKIITVKHKELLGPLVLDDLHRSGHSQFPVILNNIDNIVGTINITDLLEIDSSKKSQYADKIMTEQVPRVGIDDTLPVALRLLQKSRQHIIIVVNEQGETAGLLTLTDIANSLLGN